MGAATTVLRGDARVVPVAALSRFGSGAVPAPLPGAGYFTDLPPSSRFSGSLSALRAAVTSSRPCPVDDGAPAGSKHRYPWALPAVIHSSHRSVRVGQTGLEPATPGPPHQCLFSSH